MAKQRSRKEILEVLQQAAAKTAGGSSVEEVCRELGISMPTYYAWRKKYGDGSAEPDQSKWIKKIEEENALLKKLVAEQALEIARLKNM